MLGYIIKLKIFTPTYNQDCLLHSVHPTLTGLLYRTNLEKKDNHVKINGIIIIIIIIVIIVVIYKLQFSFLVLGHSTVQNLTYTVN